MNKKRLLLIAVVVAAIGGYFVWANFLKTAPSMSRLDADYRVNAVSFYAEFEESEEAANVKYQNKIVEIVGEVEGIDVSEGTLPIITFKTDGFGIVKCTMETQLSSDELNSIEINSSLVIRGELQGVLGAAGLITDVLIGRSIVIEP